MLNKKSMFCAIITIIDFQFLSNKIKEKNGKHPE